MVIPGERLEIDGDKAVTRLETSLLHASRMSKAIAEAARRMRFTTRGHRTNYAGGFRARRGEKLFRIAAIASFILMVVAPSLGAAVYFGFIASQQYVSEFRVTLGGGETAAAGPGMLKSLPIAIIVQDSEVVQKYLQSPTIAAQLAQNNNLREIYGNSQIDWFSRLRHGASIERVERYWRSMTTADIKMPGGIIVFRVRTFSPEDSLKLATAALALSEKMVNALNERMFHDTVQRATENLTDATNRLAIARVKLEQARNAEGMLSANVAATALSDLIKEVEASRIALQQDYDARLRFVAPSEPEMRTLQSQIQAADLQIADLKSRLTVTNQTGNNNVIAASIVKLGTLDVDRQIAEVQYAMAAAALQQARIVAESKLVYLNSFVSPELGELPGFPTPGEKIALVVVASLTVWGLLFSGAILTRNHMA